MLNSRQTTPKPAPVANLRPIFAIAAGLTIVLAGCRATILKPTESDESRREAQRLQGDVDRLHGRIAQLESELAIMQRAAAGEPLASLVDALPIPVRLELGRLSGPVRDADGEARLVRLYLRPLDGRGRFVHPLGDLTVELLAWPHPVPASPVSGGQSPAGNDPVRIATRQLSLAEIADAYRSGPTGTHYTIEIPVEPPLGRDASLVLRAMLADAASGRVTVLERTLSPRADARAPAGP